jgi:hypothetical protein
MYLLFLLSEQRSISQSQLLTAHSREQRGPERFTALHLISYIYSYYYLLLLLFGIIIIIIVII